MDDIYEVDSKRQEMAGDMTLRDYFALKAMHADQSNLNRISNPINIANRAYAIADAMLKARQ
ncbi:hypothetical protein MWS69_002634 [Citrobacter amalonaticus]|nr:hypothetical protein [Citrobacter amalonaticus]